jgi:hypothetical protein
MLTSGERRWMVAAPGDGLTHVLVQCDDRGPIRSIRRRILTQGGHKQCNGNRVSKLPVSPPFKHSFRDVHEFRGPLVDARKIVQHMKSLGELPEIVVRS